MLARERTTPKMKVSNGQASGIPDAGAVQREIDRAGHDLIRVMIETAGTQQPRRVQHEAAGQILKLRAREIRNVGTHPLRAFPLLSLSCFPVGRLSTIMLSPTAGFAAAAENFAAAARL